MKNLIKYLFILVIIVCSAVYLHLSLNKVSASSPSSELALSTKSFNQDIYYLKSSGSPDVFKSVQVIRDEPNVLELRVIYDYDGENGAAVSSCGGVIKTDRSSSVEWGCRPSRLKNGQHTALYRIKLLQDKIADYRCTDSVRIDMYTHGGANFVNQIFSYDKTWIDGKGFEAQLKQLIYGFIKC